MATQIQLEYQCPMCGKRYNSRSDDSPYDEVAGLSRKAETLRRQAEELLAGHLTIQQLRTLRQQMCSTCRLLLEGISTEGDRDEVVTRIEQDLKVLNELVAKQGSSPSESSLHPKGLHQKTERRQSRRGGRAA